MKLLAILLSAVGIIVLAVVILSPTPHVQEEISNTPHQIGEVFSIGYWSYRCNGAHWQRAIADGFTAETPDAAFLVVDLTVQNNDRTESTLPPPKLMDEQGREFSESPKGTLMTGSFEILKTLNPGVSSRGLVVFDVPPNGRYVLQVSGGLESAEHAIVNLMEKPRPEEEQPATFAPAEAQPQSERQAKSEDQPEPQQPEPAAVTGQSSEAKRGTDQLRNNTTQVEKDSSVGFPTCLYCPQPPYTEEARTAKVQGTVQLQVVIQPDGRATNIEVVKSLGYGLDELAVETVQTWRFKPANRADGTPIATVTPIGINYRLP